MGLASLVSTLCRLELDPNPLFDRSNLVGIRIRLPAWMLSSFVSQSFQQR